MTPELYREEAYLAYLDRTTSPDADDRPIRPRFWPALTALVLLAVGLVGALVVPVRVTASAVPLAVRDGAVLAMVTGTSGVADLLGRPAELTVNGRKLEGTVERTRPEDVNALTGAGGSAAGVLLVRIRVAGATPPAVGSATIDVGSRSLAADFLG